MNTFEKKLLIVLLLAFGQWMMSQTLDVRIKNIRNTKGQLCLAIFADDTGFKAEKTCWNMNCLKKDIKNGEFHIQIPFRQGKWGFSVLDDENGNGKMEYNFIGIPKKGFGFSDYILRGLHRPSFDDFSFIIDKNEPKTIVVYMTYY